MRIVSRLVAVTALALLAVNVAFIGYYGSFIVLPIALTPIALIGALFILRVPWNVVGWLLAGSGLAFGTIWAGAAYAWFALVETGGRWPGGELAAVFANQAFGGAIGLMLLTLLYFPTGRGLGGRWTWGERALVAIVVVIAVSSPLRDVPLDVNGPQGAGLVLRVTNPLAPQGAFGAIVGLLAHLADSWTIPIVLIGPASLIARYRRSGPVQREQIKWLAYSTSISFSLEVLSNFLPGGVADWIWAAGLLAFGFVPIAIAVAIFRYRLYEIDLLIRRTLVYAFVSAVLAGAYVAAIAAFEAIFAPFTAGNGVAVALSTLAVVALFQPVRRRIGAWVDRRFYRAMHTTVQPTHLAVWLREAGR